MSTYHDSNDLVVPEAPKGSSWVHDFIQMCVTAWHYVRITRLQRLHYGHNNFQIVYRSSRGVITEHKITKGYKIKGGRLIFKHHTLDLSIDIAIDNVVEVTSAAGY